MQKSAVSEQLRRALRPSADGRSGAGEVARALSDDPRTPNAVAPQTGRPLRLEQGMG